MARPILYEWTFKHRKTGEVLIVWGRESKVDAVADLMSVHGNYFKGEEWDITRGAEVLSGGRKTKAVVVDELSPLPLWDEPKTFADRLRAHLDEAEDIREGLADHGPILIRRLQDRDGWGAVSLRALAREVGLSPTYLSRVMNGQIIISTWSYLKLHELLRKEQV